MSHIQVPAASDSDSVANSSVLIDIESLTLPAANKPAPRRPKRSPSTRIELLSVVSLCVVAPLEFLSFFVASFDIVTGVFGFFCSSIAIAMLSSYMMRVVHVRHEIDFTMLLTAASVMGLLISTFVGYDLHQWMLYGRPETVKVDNLRRSAFTISTSAHLHSFDFSGLHVSVADRHIGEYWTADSHLYCAVPLHLRGSLSRRIQAKEDIPLNWAICRSQISLADTPLFSCASYYKNAVLEHSDPSALDVGADVVDKKFLECIRGWSTHDRGFDLRQVSTQMTRNAMQATKKALEAWAPLEKEIDNPLILFDDDEDLRDLTFVQLVDECCADNTRTWAWRTLRDFVMGNALWVFYCISFFGRLQRTPSARRTIILFVGYLLLVAFVLFLV